MLPLLNLFYWVAVGEGAGNRLEMYSMALFRPGINMHPEWSDHKWTALSTGVNALKTHWGRIEIRSLRTHVNTRSEQGLWPHVPPFHAHHTTQHRHTPCSTTSLALSAWRLWMYKWQTDCQQAYSHAHWTVTWYVWDRSSLISPRIFIILWVLHMHRICRSLFYAWYISSIRCIL